ncbi:MAG: hypothetical protein H0U16_08975 [Actinobacteria bacterium]|nr:hypothetical protein [Actinomycetota bacterium]
MADVPRYRFGPLERRGLLAGLRGPQIAILGVAGLVVVVALRALPPASGLLVATTTLIIGVSGGFIPIGGRTLDEWLPVLISWAARTVSGTRRFSSGAPARGLTARVEEQPHFPPVLRDIALLSHEIRGTGVSMGVLKDRREGTYTGVLATRGKSFALLDGPEKARRLSSWAGILAGLAREGGVVHRIQWIERTVPDPGNEVGKYLKERMAVPLDSPIARSYLEVVDQAGPTTQEHEVFIGVQIHGGRSSKLVKAAGGGDAGACEVLRRELAALSSSLMGTDVAVEGALTPRLVAHVMRSAFDPASRQQMASIASKNPERAGTAVVNAGPMATDESWSSYRTDSGWHSTYWIAEWPRLDVDPDFLAPLLLRTEAMRTVSLTMEPVSPLKAIRAVESARTSAAADEELRQRAGFVSTTRRRKEQDALVDHEHDLSEGHAFYRFAGFVTVTAPTSDELASACSEIEEAAGRSFLDLRRLRGEQARAFTYTLPLCRGLK